MNIGITCAPTVGGSGAVAAALGVQLAQRGHDVHFIAERLPFHLGEFRDNINVHEAEVGHPGAFDQAPTGLALAAKMAEVAREHRLDILHVHYAIPYSITGFLARQIVGESAPKLITTLHGTDITLVGQDRSFYEITRFGIQHSDGVTAVSHFLRAMTQDELKVSREIEVVPNFVDLTECCPDRAYSGTERLAEAGHALLLHTSTLRPGNRVLDLIRILERVNAEVAATLMVVGDGPERAAAQALARRCGVADRVRFVGRVESLPEIMAAAQLFPPPIRARVFRTHGSRGDGVRRAGRRNGHRRSSPKSSSMPRQASCSPSATSREWPRAASSCCRTRPASSRWARPAAGERRRCSARTAWCRPTSVSTRRRWPRRRRNTAQTKG